MKPKPIYKRIGAFLLCFALLIGLLPTSALAEDADATAGAFEVTGGTSETDYSYSNGVLTVKNGANITISMTSGANTPTSDRIVVADNATATITLAGVNIKGSDCDGAQVIAAKSAIDLSNGSILTIDLSANTENTLTGGSGSTEGSGAPGIHVPDSASLIIQGEGSLSVSGGTSSTAFSGVGIGGNASTTSAGEACGTVICFASGNVTITAGTQGSGSVPADNIGGGNGQNQNNGDDGQGIRPGTDGNYTVYGDLTLPRDITISNGATVTIPDGASLTVPESTTLTNNGTILVQGGTFTNNGTVSGNQPTYPSKVTVSFSQNGEPVNSVTYGSTVTITATMEKAETAANALSADTGKVDFYLGDANDTTGMKMGTGTVKFENGAYTASVDVTIGQDKGFNNAGTFKFTADFGGYAPDGDESGDSLAPNTGSAELTVTKAEQTAPNGTFLTLSSTENSIEIRFHDLSQTGNENGIEIAYAVGPTASEPTSNWTTAEKTDNSTGYSATIGQLSPGTPYVFFARYKGDDTHEPSPPFGNDFVRYTRPKIITTSLPNAYVGVEYSQKLEAEAAEDVAVSWTITSGTLPAGLTLNSDGTITGTPTTPTTQAANFTVNATIGEGASSVFSTQTLTISVTKSDAALGNLTVSGQTGFDGHFQYGDTITVTFTPERKANTSTNALAENTATLTYTPDEVEEVTLATATAQDDGSFTLTYDTKKKELPIGEDLSLAVSYGGSGALNPGEETVTLSLDQAILLNVPTISGKFVYGETLTVNYTKQDDETVTYQWYRVGNEPGGETIAGATGPEYKLTLEDIGNQIYVNVRATDEWHRGSMQSTNQDVVAKAPGSIKIACDSVTYGETVQPSVTSNTNTGVDVTYSYAGTDGTSYGPSSEAPQNAGTYTVTATVAETATHTAATSDPVTFTISKAYQTAPTAPAAARTTSSSITLNTISANANGAAAEYGISKDGGKTWTWQSSPEFTGLSSGIEYTFAARYAETGNYNVSASSATVKFRTSSPYVPPAPTGPVTEGGASGWDGVEDEIADAQPGDTVTIDMNGETEVPAEVFEEVAGKDVTVEINLGGGVSWSVNGTDVPEGVSLADLDLGVSLGTSGISLDVINFITGEYGSVQITLEHDGEFGFALTLTAPLGRENAGHWANLYHYDEARERLTFETSARIAADGSAALRMTHASQYAIVIDAKSHAMPFADVDSGDWYYDAVSYVYANGLMDGTSATTFEPNATLTRAMLVTILWRMEGEPVVNYLMPFTDVDGVAWYAEAVRWASSEGIVEGVSDTSFAPNAEITREQLAAILYRYAGEPATAANLAGYADGASVSAYAVDAMSWCVEHGIITGTTATTLEPQGTATRAQAAAMLMRFAENLK